MNSENALPFRVVSDWRELETARGISDLEPELSAVEKETVTFLTWKIWEARRTNGLDRWLLGEDKFAPPIELKLPVEEVTRELYLGLWHLMTKRYYRENPNRWHEAPCYRVVDRFAFPFRWSPEKVVTVQPGKVLIVETRLRYFFKEQND